MKLKANRVSTSEVATYLTCQRRWMYAHHPSYALEPRTLGIALTRGIVGHRALEYYYQYLLDGQDTKTAELRAINHVMSESIAAIQVGDGEKSTMLNELAALLKEYFSFSEKTLRGYKITGVEELIITKLPIDEPIEFAGRVDLVLEVIEGPYRGWLKPFDHKFTYDFWSPWEMNMHPQLPNYEWGMRQLGRRTAGGMMNFLRYRSNAIEKFKVVEHPSTEIIRRNFIQDHVHAASDITALKEMPEVTDTVTRSASRFNCRYCPFNKLCYTELQEKNSSNLIEAEFRPNTYGYVDTELDIN